MVSIIYVFLIATVCVLGQEAPPPPDPAPVEPRFGFTGLHHWRIWFCHAFCKTNSAPTPACAFKCPELVQEPSTPPATTPGVASHTKKPATAKPEPQAPSTPSTTTPSTTTKKSGPESTSSPTDTTTPARTTTATGQGGDKM